MINLFSCRWNIYFLRLLYLDFLLLNLSWQPLNVISFVINVGLWAVKYLNIFIKEKSIILNLLVFIRKSKNIFIGKERRWVSEKLFSLVGSDNSWIRLKNIDSKHEIHPLCKIVFDKLLVSILDLSFENVFDALVPLNQAILSVEHFVHNLSNRKVLVYEPIEET